MAVQDFDNFRRLWEEQQFVCTFMAPLTVPGQAVLARICELEGPSEQPEVRVAQDKFFQGIYDFEIHRRIPVVKAFQGALA